MPAKYSGLLDQTRLENVDLQSAIWKPVRVGRWNLDAIRPEFFSLRRNKSVAPKLRPTAWLDGLRGFAAFLVCLHHNQLWAHGMKGNLVLENGFGYEGRHYFAALPFVRIFFSGGHFAVSIFFVISGYVLSVKSLSLIHAGQSANTVDVVGSALFRRWLRLYLPIITITFSWLCIRHATKIWVDMGEIEDSFGKDVIKWYRMFKNYSFVFSENIYQFTGPYHPHLWSIPIEFKGSIIIYTTLSALSRCSRNARLSCEAGLIFYFLYIVDGWYGALFMSGMLLCDLDLLVKSEQLPRFLSMFSNFKEMIYFHLFILSLYLAGVPSYDGVDDRIKLLRQSPGWYWLSYLKPQAVFDAKWFYLTWAAFFAVASIPHLPWLKQFFETRFCQYLGKISFALYLVHGPVIWSLGDRLYAAVGLSRSAHNDGIPGWVNKFPLSQKGPMGLDFAFWVLQPILIPLTFYAAEIVTRLVDEPSTRFANWTYKKTLSENVPAKR